MWFLTLQEVTIRGKWVKGMQELSELFLIISFDSPIILKSPMFQTKCLLTGLNLHIETAKTKIFHGESEEYVSTVIHGLDSFYFSEKSIPNLKNIVHTK